MNENNVARNSENAHVDGVDGMVPPSTTVDVVEGMVPPPTTMPPLPTMPPSTRVQ